MSKLNNVTITSQETNDLTVEILPDGSQSQLTEVSQKSTNTVKKTPIETIDSQEESPRQPNAKRCRIDVD